MHGDFLPLVARGPATGGGGSTRAELPHARGVGPGLAYVPDWEMLEQAAGYARGHALCAIEASMFGDRPGWLGAENEPATRAGRCRRSRRPAAAGTIVRCGVPEAEFGRSRRWVPDG
jgi:hypothetical protein